MLFFATLIISNKWILIIGGLYLIYLATDHLYIKKRRSRPQFKIKTTLAVVIMQIIFADFGVLD